MPRSPLLYDHRLTLTLSEKIVSFLYFGKRHHGLSQGWIETEFINNFLKIPKLPYSTLEQDLQSLRDQGLVKSCTDLKHTYNTYTPKGRDLLKSWDDGKKEEVLQFLSPFFQPLDPEE